MYETIDTMDGKRRGVDYAGKQVDIDTAAAYELCKDKLGSEVWAVVETRIYDNDKQKQKLLEVFETKETAERVCKAYMEDEDAY